MTMAPDKDAETKRAGFRPGPLFAALFAALTLVSAWKVADHLIQQRRNTDFWKDLQDKVVVMETAPPGEPSLGPSQLDQPDQREEPDRRGQQEEPVIGPKAASMAPDTIDFDTLQSVYGDVVAWIYAPGSRINYPVAQADDNDYYLRRLLNGKGAICGTIFADCRCNADLTSWNTIIYGHKMNDDTMFASLANYLDQAYYEEHPVMYLYVPGLRYRLELIAGYTTDIYDPLYTLPEAREDRDAVLARALENSTFRAGVTAGEGDRLVTLSTCSYAFDDARYVVLGRLVED